MNHLLSFTSWDALSNYFTRNVRRGNVQWREKIAISKHGLTNPKAFGLALSTGMPDGQRADYRKTLANNVGLHVQDYGDHYKVHLDEFDPQVDPVEHLRQDVPELYVLAAAGVGALLGKMFGQSKEAQMAGAFIGAVIGANKVSNAKQDDDQRRKKLK